MNTVSSIIRNLSKKGHDLVSRFTSRHYTEKEPGTSASSDSEDPKDKNYFLKEYSETKLRGLNIEEDYDTSKVPTCKDVTKPSVNQRNDLIQDWDTCNQENNCKIDFANDDWWDNGIKNNVSHEDENRKHMFNKNHNDEDIIGFTDNSLEIIDAENQRKTTV